MTQQPTQPVASDSDGTDHSTLSSSTMTRREFATTLVTVGGVLGLPSTVRATSTQSSPRSRTDLSAPRTFDHEVWADKPEFVNLAYDTDLLTRYRPRLITRGLEVKPTTQYGYVAHSSEQETGIAYYWTWYTHQKGVLPWSGAFSDSHYQDREPIAIEFDYQDGTPGAIKRVDFAGYHWFKATSINPHLYSDADGEHVIFQIAPKHHHYYTPDLDWEAFGDQGEFIPLDNGLDELEAWWDDGWRVDTEAVGQPHTLSSKADWWPDSTTGGFERTMSKIWFTLGFAGADQSDIGDL